MKLRIIIYSIVSVLLLYYLEQGVEIPYILKTLIKIPLFLIIPYMMNRYVFHIHVAFKISKKAFKYALGVSVFVMGIIMAAFLITKGFIDTKTIVLDFDQRMKIDKDLFILAAVYTIFINSFIEEFFFRGYIFQGLVEVSKPLAFTVSSFAFAFYHVGIFATWFTWPLMFLALLGLFLGGLIFSYFVYKTKSVLASYLIHMCSDIALVIIGFVWIGL